MQMHRALFVEKVNLIVNQGITEDVGEGFAPPVFLRSFAKQP